MTHTPFEDFSSMAGVFHNNFANKKKKKNFN